MNVTTRTTPVLYDPTDPGFAGRSHEVYRVLRDEHPLYADPLGRFHALSRFEDVRSATVDWETFSSTGKAEHQFQKPTMSSYDPPRHGELRALISRGFTPRRVTEMEPEIRRIATGLIDEFIERGECDAIADYAALLPSIVMGRLVGIPDDVIPVCRALTDEFMHHTAVSDVAGPAARSDEIFAGLLAERRRCPADDLLTALLAAEIDGQRLTEDELLGFGWLLLVGGNDTTTNLIANGLELFARHPDQRRQLLEDSTLIPDAVEEVLRFAPPTHSLPRTATRDIAIHDGTIPARSRVMLLWAAANLDEREFPDPERFDIRRRAPRHLALGHGAHFCLGASFARLEARVAWEEFLSRMPDYELTREPERFVSSTFSGFTALPTAFPPATTLNDRRT
jgi:cytochrome P450 family 130